MITICLEPVSVRFIPRGGVGAAAATTLGFGSSFGFATTSGVGSVLVGVGGSDLSVGVTSRPLTIVLLGEIAVVVSDDADSCVLGSGLGKVLAITAPTTATKMTAPAALDRSTSSQYRPPRPFVLRMLAVLRRM
jgi:phage tail sheath gpL-like